LTLGDPLYSLLSLVYYTEGELHYAPIVSGKKGSFFAFFDPTRWQQSKEVALLDVARAFAVYTFYILFSDKNTRGLLRNFLWC